MKSEKTKGNSRRSSSSSTTIANHSNYSSTQTENWKYKYKTVNFFLTGTILRKLPRKVDVLEGENAAYCVEVEKEEMDIHWYKDGVELRETHQTIIKSFGRTHILVFVNTMPQDSGLVTFLVGRSKTSSQLRVKGRVITIDNCEFLPFVASHS